MQNHEWKREACWLAFIVALGTAMATRADTITFQQGVSNALTASYSGAEDNVLAGYSEIAPNSMFNYGAYSIGVIGNTGWPASGATNGCACRTILRFDLSPLADKYETITVNSVTLTLTKKYVSDAGPVNVYALLPGTWQAGNNIGAAQAGASCWHSKGYDDSAPLYWPGHAVGTNGCGVAGMDYDATVLATNAWSATMGDTLVLRFDGWSGSNLTALINAWMKDPVNAGILIRTTPDKENLAGTPYLMWASCNDANTTQRPALTIDYTHGPSQKVVNFQQGVSNQYTDSYAGLMDNVLASYEETSYSAYNYGAYASGVIGNPWAPNNIARTIMRFDLASMGSLICQQVNSVTLCLTKNALKGSGPVFVYQVLSTNGNWVEGTKIGAAEDGSSCWFAHSYNETPALRRYWAGSAQGTNGCGVPDVDYQARFLGSNTWDATTGRLYVNFDNRTPAELTELVRSWISDTNNPGILIRSTPAIEADTTTHPFLMWNSKEAATASDRPMLIIRYTPIVPRGTIIVVR